MKIIDIEIVITDDKIDACYAAMSELRTNIVKSEFVDKIRLLEKSGYRLASASESGLVVAVAGFRLGMNLAWGSYLYVDDLATLSTYRSKGVGKSLLNWLREYAAKQGCSQLHLDSGVQRTAAHRFYEREGMVLVANHYYEEILPNKGLKANT